MTHHFSTKMDFTPIVRMFMTRRSFSTDKWTGRIKELQLRQLRSLLRCARNTEIGRQHCFNDILRASDIYTAFTDNVPACEYEDIRPQVLRMIDGGRDVLWPGRCMNFAQSSGTSGGRSKFIPVTPRSLHRCHYKGAYDCVSHYLRNYPGSRLFSGKALVLGGSFASEIKPSDPDVRIGDLSATLISRINPFANHFRVPDMHTALLPDWTEKLPALVEASKDENITNLSGVPSWFLTVIKEVIASKGVEKISDVWPNLEVFFHGGISFEPYREIYTELTDIDKMHFVETYNASEGFFAVQNDPSDRSMLLIIDNDIFYEFADIARPGSSPVPLWEVEKGKVYELIITSSNGLWRYRLGDTVRICSTDPVKIRIAGRTKTFINAFGEELMEDNAEHAMAAACKATGAVMRHYTAAPVFATETSRGRHEWAVEWIKPPSDIDTFTFMLDHELRSLNSDYDAKRSHTIFLDPPLVTTVSHGTFERWLKAVGTGKLGGQRKVPRLSNDRTIIDKILRYDTCAS